MSMPDWLGESDDDETLEPHYNDPEVLQWS